MSDKKRFEFAPNPHWINENIAKGLSPNTNNAVCADCGTDKSLHYIREDGKIFCNTCILSNLKKSE